jgi:hypothetical protein
MLQRNLFPLVAAGYACHFAGMHLIKLYNKLQVNSSPSFENYQLTSGVDDRNRWIAMTSPCWSMCMGQRLD